MSAARVQCPPSADEAATMVREAPPRGVIGRGLGRCYGDAAQNAGGVVLSTARLDRIFEIDPATATARVEAGVSLDKLMRATVPQGLWPAVSPGTRQVTVGGAIASDIHGKNHHADGTFGAHVESMVLATPALGTVVASPEVHGDVFWATTGGMGLTGLVLEATLRLTRIETAFARVDSERVPDLDTLMSRMVDADAEHRYTVAWVDCLASGRSLGRSILELGEHARLQDLPARLRRRPLAFDPKPRVTAPGWTPSWVLNRVSMAGFNELWYRKAPRRSEGHVVPLASFFHPLDAVDRWNRAYGPRGFLQYQMVVPDQASEVVRQAIESLSSHRCAGFLGVLKRFGNASPAPLSFPARGWTLAIDVPARAPGIGAAALGRLLDHLDELVAGCGGRVYLSKDSRLRPELLPVMYPELQTWREVRDRVDPDRRLRSDLCRRLWPLLGGTERGAGSSDPAAALA